MDNAEEVLKRLKDKYKIIVVSCGYSPNLIAKRRWVEINMPYVQFVGVDFKKHEDKKHVLMGSDSIFIDDSLKMLNSSDAKYKICFGDYYLWNCKWDGMRCFNWYEVEEYIKEIEKEDGGKT
jgi:5'(3')-deoxyribonucleotidase